MSLQMMCRHISTEKTMKYEVKYSKGAIRDLDKVWSEILEVSKSYDITTKYIDGLINKVSAKADHPKSGSPVYYEDSFTGYYFVVFKSYMVFYRLKDNVILVDRVLYGKSDYMRHLHINSDDEI